jgi:tripartite-type tricarboxylate transporter receptor subunit TctC
MLNFRRLASTAFASTAAALLLCAPAAAQAPYPSSPIRMLFTFGVGGPGDMVARTFAERLTADLGQQVIVENRTGADGVIGMKAAIASKPDGYTFLLISGANLTLPLLKEGVYDLEKDLVPIAGIGSIPYTFVVSGKSSIRTIADLGALGKTRVLNYGSGGYAGPSHIASARLMGDLKVDSTHVPYRGLSPAMTAVVGTQIDFMAASPLDVLQHHKAGTARVIGVTTEHRLPELPDVPTMAEQGFKDFHFSTWYAFLAPANTPKPIVDRLHAAIGKATADASVQDKLSKIGLTLKLTSGAEIASFMREEAVRMRRVIKDNNIKLEN